jgi:hypothetical protein
MSQKALEKIISLAQRDRVLCEKLQRAKTLEAFVEIGDIYGYKFSVSELIAFMKARFEALLSQQSETHSFLEDLSDDEAEIVAGGRMTAYRVSVNSYYHETGLIVDCLGKSGFYFYGTGIEELGRDFYTSAFSSSIYGKIVSILTRYTTEFGVSISK